MGGIRTPALANGLTAKQEAFCIFYHALRNGTQAAERAGYSPDTARFQASDLLTMPNIKARLAELQAHSVPSADAVCADKAERMRILSEIVRTKPQSPVSAGHVITATAELNKMDGSYAPVKSLNAQAIEIRVVYQEPIKLKPGPTPAELPTGEHGGTENAGV